MFSQQQLRCVITGLLSPAPFPVSTGASTTPSSSHVWSSRGSPTLQSSSCPHSSELGSDLDAQLQSTMAERVAAESSASRPHSCVRMGCCGSESHRHAPRHARLARTGTSSLEEDKLMITMQTKQPQASNHALPPWRALNSDNVELRVMSDQWDFRRCADLAANMMQHHGSRARMVRPHTPDKRFPPRTSGFSQ